MAQLNLLPKALQFQPTLHDRIANRWRRDQHVVGIAFDADAIRAAHVVRTKDGSTRLVQVQKVDLPPAAINEEGIENATSVVAALQTLQEQLVAGGMPTWARVVLGFAGHHLITRTIVLPNMPDRELEESIAWEAEQYVPFDINDVFVAVERSPTPSIEPGTMNVVLAAAVRRSALPFIDAVRGVGFRLAAMEPYAWSIGRYARTMPPTLIRSMGTAKCLVHIDANLTSVSITRNGAALFVRDVSTFGAVLFVETIEKELRVPRETAKEYIRRHCTHEWDAASEETALQVSGIVKHVAEMLARETQRTFDFYAAITIGKENLISSIELLGPGSEIPEIAAAISACSSLTVDTPAHFDAASTEVSAMTQLIFALPIGLALRNDWTQSAHDVGAETATSIREVAPIRRPKPRPTPEPIRLYTPSHRELIRLFTDLAFAVEIGGATSHDALVTIAGDDRSGSRRFRRAISAADARLANGDNVHEAIASTMNIPPILGLVLRATYRGSGTPAPFHACRQYLLGDPFEAVDVTERQLAKRRAR
ncbi:MAG: pilus assembly protein PilM [Candidatus Uhrbacteria bacterium]